MAVGDGGRVSADGAERDAGHRCPGCGAPVRLKRGRFVTAHFAHHADSPCGWGTGETAVHLDAKRSLCAALVARGLDARLEIEVDSLVGDRRADILVRSPRTGAPIAIEIQHSDLAVDAIEARTRAYAAAGVAVLWIPTLDQARLGLASVPGTRLSATTRYAAPEWQRWAAAYHGHLWFWCGDALRRGWLDQGWVAAAHTADNGGWRPSRRFVSLTLEAPVAPRDLRLAIGRRLASPHERYRLPTGPGVTMLAPGETRSPPPPSAPQWIDRGGRFSPGFGSPDRVSAHASLRTARRAA